MKKKPAKKDIAIAYTSLHMNEGKRQEELRKKIQELSAKKPYAWFVDIICTPNQIPEGRRAAAAAYGWTGKFAPQIPDDKVIIGVTTKKDDRPARTIMYRLSNSFVGELTAGLQLDSGRRFLWIGGEPQHKVEEVQDDSTSESPVGTSV